MDRVAYSDIERQVADLVGWDGANLSADERRLILAAVNQELRQMWNAAWWPELMEVRETPFAQEWRSGTTYPAGTILWDGVTGQYVFAIRDTVTKPYTGSGDDLDLGDDWDALPVDTSAADLWDETASYEEGDVVEWNGAWYCTGAHGAGTTSEPGTNAHWVRVPDLVPEVPLAAYGRPKIGRVRRATPLDPRSEPNADAYVLSAGRDGVRVEECEVYVPAVALGVSVPWLEYRVAFAPLRGDEFDATATYTAARLEDAVWGLE